MPLSNIADFLRGCLNAISFSISTYLSPKPRKGCIHLESTLVYSKLPTLRHS